MTIREKKSSVVISIMLVVLMLFTMFPVGIVNASDIEGHWAEESIIKWQNKGLILGYEDGSFKPQDPITRAEFVSLVNKIFEFDLEGEVDFSDLDSGDWFYSGIVNAVEAGYLSGYPDGTVKPNNEITREEAAVLTAIVFELEEKTSLSAEIFADSDDIAEWALNSVGLLVERKIIEGYMDGSFKPQNNITRAEAVTILNNASGDIYNEEGTYSKDAEGNVVVNKDGITLNDMLVKGDLYLADGIGDGTVILESVTVEGTTYVKAGGENSIILRNSKLADMVVNKRNAREPVRVRAEGTSSVSGSVTVNSGVNLETDGTSSEKPFKIVEITNNVPQDEKVKLNGDFGDVKVSSNNKVELVGGSVGNLNISSAADISVSKEMNVSNVVVEATATGAQIRSEATLSIEVHAEGVRVNNRDVEVGEKVEITEEDLDETDEEDTPTSSPSVGGGSGSPVQVGNYISIADVVGGTATVTASTTRAEEEDTITVNIGNIQTGKEFASIEVAGDTSSDIISTTEVTPGQVYTFEMPDEDVTITVELEDILVTGISINEANQTISDDETVQLTVTFTPSNPYNTGASWTSTNESVATVDSNGLVTAVGGVGGETTIEVESDDGNFTDTVNITVDSVTVTNLTQFDNAVGESAVTQITLGAGIGQPSAIERLVDIDFGGHEIDGNLDIDTTESGFMTISGAGSITGDLTVYAENATINSDLDVNGSTTIVAISYGSFNSTGTHGDGNITMGGPGTINLSGNATAAAIDVNTTDEVEIDGECSGVTISQTNTTRVRGRVPIITVNAANSRVERVIGSSVDEVEAEATDVVIAREDGLDEITVSGTELVSASQPREYRLTMEANPTAGGTVSGTGSTNSRLFAEGIVVDINATPETGYEFAGWEATEGTFVEPSTANTDFTMPAEAVTVTANFTPIAVTGVDIDAITPGDEVIKVGDTLQLSETITPGNALDQTVTWASNSTGVATVDGSGEVTGVAAGTADITVTTNDGGHTSTVTITVEDKEIVSVEAIGDVTVAHGTPLAGAKAELPITVEVTLDDSTTETLAVTWDNGTPLYDGNTADTYIFTGMITLVAGIANDAGVEATVDVIVEPNNDADLANLTVTVGTLDPVFDAAETTYTVNVDHDVSELDVIATLSDPNASMEINSVAVTSGEAETITLEPAGYSTTITIEVTAEDSSTEKTYTITANRAEVPPTPVLSDLNIAESGTTTATINEGDSEDISVTVTNEGAEASFDIFIVFGPGLNAQTITTGVIEEGTPQVVTFPGITAGLPASYLDWSVYISVSYDEGPELDSISGSITVDAIAEVTHAELGLTADSAISSDDTTATVEVTAEGITITAVSGGTATITVQDLDSNLVTVEVAITVTEGAISFDDIDIIQYPASFDFVVEYNSVTFKIEDIVDASGNAIDFGDLGEYEFDPEISTITFYSGEDPSEDDNSVTYTFDALGLEIESNGIVSFDTDQDEVGNINEELLDIIAINLEEDDVKIDVSISGEGWNVKETFNFPEGVKTALDNRFRATGIAFGTIWIDGDHGGLIEEDTIVIQLKSDQVFGIPLIDQINPDSFTLSHVDGEKTFEVEAVSAIIPPPREGELSRIWIAITLTDSSDPIAREDTLSVDYVADGTDDLTGKIFNFKADNFNVEIPALDTPEEYMITATVVDSEPNTLTIIGEGQEDGVGPSAVYPGAVVRVYTDVALQNELTTEGPIIADENGGFEFIHEDEAHEVGNEYWITQTVDGVESDPIEITAEGAD